MGCLGYNHSEETKARMSIIKKGNKFGVGNKANFGRKHTIETKIKMSKAHLGNKSNFGRKLPIEQKLKMSIAHKTMSAEKKMKVIFSRTGAKSNFWKGGITKATKLRVAKPSWKRISNKIRERDNNTCKKCGLRGNKTTLAVHHKVPFFLTQNNSPENLITLCNSCHRREDLKYIDETLFLT